MNLLSKICKDFNISTQLTSGELMTPLWSFRLTDYF